MLKRAVNNALAVPAQTWLVDGPKTIGDRIRDQRKAKNLKLKPVAKAAGITISALSQIETGVTVSPTPETLFRIADALDVEPRFLVFGNHDRQAPSLSALSLTDTGRFRLRHRNK